MKYDPDAHALQFTNEDEVNRFHAELTSLLRVAVTSVSRHGEAEQGKAAAQGVFKEFAAVMRALNALRKHLQPTGE